MFLAKFNLKNRNSHFHSNKRALIPIAKFDIGLVYILLYFATSTTIGITEYQGGRKCWKVGIALNAIINQGPPSIGNTRPCVN